MQPKLYRLVGYLLSDNGLICWLHTQCMISKSDIQSVLCNGVFVVICGYFKTILFVILKTILLLDSVFVISKIINYLNHDYSRITKTSSKNCLLFAVNRPLDCKPQNFEPLKYKEG